MKTIFCLIFLSFLSSAFSQEDASDCKDHFLFGRMPKTNISECVVRFEKAEIKTGDESSETKPGIKTDIDYAFNGGEKNAPSFAGILKYYEGLIQKYSGKKIYEGKEQATWKATAAGKIYWIQVKDMSNFSAGNYGLIVLESEAEKTPVNAKEMGDMLVQNGSITLYPNFEKGTTTINADTRATLNQLATALRQHPLLRISIEMHSDNSESADISQSASEKRAAVIFNYLNSKGIGKFRMKAAGFGQAKPVADNSSEDGRSKNRRLEVRVQP